MRMAVQSVMVPTAGLSTAAAKCAAFGRDDRAVVVRAESKSAVVACAMMACAIFCLGAPAVRAQTKAPAPLAPPQAVQKMPAVAGTQLDRVVAIVNDQLILDSDVDQERRLEALQPYHASTEPFSRDQAIERLIDRDLILQQVQLQPQDKISDSQVETELDALRKNIPQCKQQYDCATKAGWDKFLAANGFTEASLMELWRARMEVLRFIEQRFRAGIRITPAEVNEYYTKTMIPEYAKRGVSAPPVATVSTRIQDVLLEQKVSGLLADWLKSLRAQGSVVVLHPGEEAP
jgi:peptidyl-prolyl cis-trans isomerase SurA